MFRHLVNMLVNFGYYSCCSEEDKRKSMFGVGLCINKNMVRRYASPYRDFFSFTQSEQWNMSNDLCK